MLDPVVHCRQAAAGPLTSPLAAPLSPLRLRHEHRELGRREMARHDERILRRGIAAHSNDVRPGCAHDSCFEAALTERLLHRLGVLQALERRHLYRPLSSRRARLARHVTTRRNRHGAGRDTIRDGSGGHAHRWCRRRLAGGAWRDRTTSLCRHARCCPTETSQSACDPYSASRSRATSISTPDHARPRRIAYRKMHRRPPAWILCPSGPPSMPCELATPDCQSPRH